MHFVLAWNINTTDSAKANEILDALTAAIKPYSWVRPLTDFYIIRVDSQTEWDAIHQALTAIAKRYPTELSFVMSPPIESGRYDGWLPESLWKEINERAK